jgi:hypothetical protein
MCKKFWGGEQAHSHDSLLKDNEGYLGPFPKMLQYIDIKSMFLNQDDPGPFWLSAEERLLQINDEIPPGEEQVEIQKGLASEKAEAGVTIASKKTYQVLWERGILDPLNLNQYTMDGLNDQFGIHQWTISLKHILSNCKDFKYYYKQWPGK